MSEFFAREQTHIGRYISDSVLAKEGNRDLAFVLSMKIPGLRAVPEAPDVLTHYKLVSTRPQPGKYLGEMNPVCNIDVYIDGAFSHGDLNALFPQELAGVEYYSMESAPVQYRRATGSCGVLLLWTKF